MYVVLGRVRFSSPWLLGIPGDVVVAAGRSSKSWRVWHPGRGRMWGACKRRCMCAHIESGPAPANPYLPPTTIATITISR
eukprot:2655412-Pyramimonas_sp.AAC.1